MEYNPHGWVSMSIRVPPDLKSQIDRAAETLHAKTAQFVRQALAERSAEILTKAGQGTRAESAPVEAA